MSESQEYDKYLPKSELDKYPINRDFYEPVDALDIHKTKKTWIALIAVQSKFGRKIRFYKWRWNENQNKWSVDWARMDIDNWNMENISLFLQRQKNSN